MQAAKTSPSLRPFVVVTAVVVLLALTALLARKIRTPSHQLTPVEIWSIDLKADREFSLRTQVFESLLTPPDLSFLNDDQIICGFYSGAEIGTGEFSKGSGFHVLEVSAKDGAPGRRLDIQSVDDYDRALPVDGGGFVVLAGDKLAMFDSRFKPGPSISVAPVQPGEVFDIRHIDVSPSGQTVLLYSRRAGGETSRWAWLRSSDLSPIQSEDIAHVGNVLEVQTSDKFAIGVGGPEPFILENGAERSICSGCKAELLTDSLFFIDKGNRYSIQTLNGHQIGTGPLNIDADHLVRAKNVTRLAFVTGHYSDGSGFLIQTNFRSVTGKVEVLDWSSNKLLAQIDIREQIGNPSAGLSQMALALSPDGKLLAVLLHHTLTLYRLP